jgi:hypothetical protein
LPLLSAGEVIAFVQAECPGLFGRLGKVHRHRAALAIEVLLPGRQARRALADAVPAVAAWKLAGLPRALSREQVSAPCWPVATGGQHSGDVTLPS